jgi:hypothetical protein
VQTLKESTMVVQLTDEQEQVRDAASEHLSRGGTELVALKEKLGQDEHDAARRRRIDRFLAELSDFQSSLDAWR